VLKGFMIFLTATAWPVNWSLAELDEHCKQSTRQLRQRCNPTRPVQKPPFQRAASPCTWRSFSTNWTRKLQSTNLLVISKVVPKIWARTNSAILTGSAATTQAADREEVLGASGTLSLWLQIYVLCTVYVGRIGKILCDGEILVFDLQNHT